ncbi:unnamed protein product [Adineta ricciae]|uniref:Uncharacterized protein n=1 Tax=Adineta ricciae TaxID=249248 RepID=A0A814FMC6_ADIRI|nr:unnamed protein product [Adineta ricciae]
MLNNYLGMDTPKSRYFTVNLYLVSLLFTIVFSFNALNGNPVRPSGGLLGSQDLHHHVKGFAYAHPCEILCMGKLSSKMSIKEKSKICRKECAGLLFRPAIYSNYVVQGKKY